MKTPYNLYENRNPKDDLMV